MRICQIMLAKGFGGAERIFVDYCIGLKQKGHEVLAIIDVHSDSKKHLEKHNINFEEINIRFRKNPFARKKAKKIISQYNPNIVHVHLRRAMDFISPIKEYLTAPLIASIHNYNSIKTYASADCLVAITKDQQQYVVEKDNTLKDKTIVIPNFSRLPPIKPSFKQQENICLLSYGRFVHKKGFDVLLKAFAKAKKENNNLLLTIAGDGELKKELFELREKLNLTTSVDIRPWSNSVIDLLDEHDVFILPSRIEPFGIVLLEAMARGKLIISTKSEGPKQFLNEKTSLMCNIDDELDLATQISLVVNKFPDLQSRAIQANKIYKEKYYIDAVMPKVEFLYEQISNKTI